MQGADGSVGWTVLDINTTCTDQEPQCLQLQGVHAFSNCDMTSHQYAKYLSHRRFPRIMPGKNGRDTSGPDGDCNKRGHPCRLPASHFQSRKRSPKDKALSATSTYLFVHMSQANLLSAADYAADIIQFGYGVRDSFPAPVTQHSRSLVPLYYMLRYYSVYILLYPAVSFAMSCGFVTH